MFITPTDPPLPPEGTILLPLLSLSKKGNFFPEGVQVGIKSRKVEAMCVSVYMCEYTVCVCFYVSYSKESLLIPCCDKTLTGLDLKQIRQKILNTEEYKKIDLIHLHFLLFCLSSDHVSFVCHFLPVLFIFLTFLQVSNT